MVFNLMIMLMLLDFIFIGGLIMAQIIQLVSGNNFGSFGANFNSSARTPDNTSTWWTTNDATFEITGVQLEVGPVATPFEHLSLADDLRRCERYFEVDKMNSGTGGLLCLGKLPK